MRSITHMRTTLMGAAIAGLLVLSSCTASPTPSATFPGTGCPLFPADNVWHAEVTGLPVHARSSAYVASIGRSSGLKADFGSGQWDGGPIGIPYTVVGAGQRRRAGRLRLRRRERPRAVPDPGRRARSRVGPTATATGTCSWSTATPAGSTSSSTRTRTATARGTPARARSTTCARTALRPAGWTSADAAGLPILPGLVRYDEVAAGHDRPRHPGHRPDVARTAYVWPARHQAGVDAPIRPARRWACACG